MKVGTILFIQYLNTLVEVVSVKPGEIQVIMPFLDDITCELWISKRKYKKYTVIGEI